VDTPDNVLQYYNCCNQTVDFPKEIIIKAQN